jgi:hypothetical protein
MSQIDRVSRRNWSPLMVLCPRWARSMRPLENTRMYSWTSRSTGLAADRNEPHAQLPNAPAALRQMISPRMWNPRSVMIVVT